MKPSTPSVPLSFLLAFAGMAFSFFAVLWGWSAIDDLCGRAEVSRFIREHTDLVEARRQHPKVHEFSIQHDPEDFGALLITMDVDDKQTYDMLREDVKASWDLSVPPRMQTNLRSNENLENDFGYAAWGIAMVMTFVLRFIIAVTVSIFVFLLLMWRLLIRPMQIRNARPFQPKEAVA